jgi:hypothetical protein
MPFPDVIPSEKENEYTKRIRNWLMKLKKILDERCRLRQLRSCASVGGPVKQWTKNSQMILMREVQKHFAYHTRAVKFPDNNDATRAMPMLKGKMTFYGRIRKSLWKQIW